MAYTEYEVNVIELVKACRKAGVTRFKKGEMEIEFAPGEAAQTQRVQTPEVVVPPTDEELARAGSDAEAQRHRELQDDDLAQMQIEDPSRYEELLLLRELELGEETALD